MKVLAISPYAIDPLYPVFGSFLGSLSSRGSEVHLFAPGLSVTLIKNGVKLSKLKKATIPKVHHLVNLAQAFFVVLYFFLFKRNFTIITLGPVLPVMLIPFILFKKAKGVKFVSYQPELFEGRIGALMPFFRFSVKHADLFIDVNVERLNFRKNEYHLITQKDAILPNFPKLAEFPDIHDREAKLPYRMVYGGSLSLEHGIDQLLKSIAADHSLPIELHLFVIDHFNSHKIQATLKDIYKFESRIIWHKSLPRSQFMKKLVNYDLGFCSYPFVEKKDGKGSANTNLNSKFAAPTKIFDYISAGLVVISGRHPTFKNLEECGAAALFDYDNPESLKKAIMDGILLRKKSRQSEISQIAKTLFTIDKNLDSLIAEINNSGLSRDASEVVQKAGC